MSAQPLTTAAPAVGDPTGAGTPLLTRQPIVDAAEQVAGYELLFPGPRQPDGRPAAGGDATSEVIWNAWMELGRHHLAGSHPLWIDVTAEYLTRSDTLAVHPADVVLELRGDTVVDEELLVALERFTREGYRFALDDFAPDGPATALLPLARAVKLDVGALGMPRVIAEAHALHRQQIAVLAIGVGTREVFEALRASSVTLFQGAFYEQARVLERHDRVPMRAVSSVRSLGELQDAGDDLDRLEPLVAEDPVLAFRVLRLANSAFHSRATPAQTVREALVRVGSRQAREWLAMALVHGVGDPDHPALQRGIARARLCAALAEPEHRSRCFLLGLLSVLDALVAPLPLLAQEAGLDDAMTAALLHRQGTDGLVLAHAIAIQDGVVPPTLRMDAAAAARSLVDAEAWATGSAATMRD